MINVSNIPVLNVLPQRPPFVMISRLVEYDDNAMLCETEVTPEGLPDGAFEFICRDGVYDDAALVENIAQTCAARVGYYNKYILKRGVEIGFIGAIRVLNIHRLPCVGETFQTAITIKSSAFGFSLADAEVMTLSGEIIAEGEMKFANKE